MYMACHHIKRTASFILLLLAASPAFLHAQEKLILDTAKPYQRIGKFVYYIKDPQRKISFEEASNPALAFRYTKSEQESNNFGNVEMAVWNRFTITNPTQKKWLLSVEAYNIDYIEFYYPDTLTGKYRKELSGRHLPFSAMKYKSNDFVFAVSVPKDSTYTFYLKIDAHYMQYPLSITTQEKFIEQSHRKDLFTGIYYGLVIVFMFYNLFVYFSVKDKSYLYYVVYIFFNALLIAQLKGLTAEIFGDPLHFLWNYAPAVIAVTSLFSFIFTRHILETKTHAPLADKLIVYGFFPAYIITFLLSVLHRNLYASILNQMLGMLALLFLFSVALYIYRKGFKPARFYIVASFFYFLGVLIYVLKGFDFLPFNAITNNSIEVGSTLQMIMFAFVIADRLKIFKTEKENAQTDLVASLQENQRLITEQKNVLEIKVKERTAELTKEKERSDELLLNILPAETARELKETGRSEPKLFEQVTVIFTDFKDFTLISENLSPAELVSEMNYCFSEFDRIISTCNIEKIKTIGDSYMAAGGLPIPNQTHAKDTIRAALAIREFMQGYNKKRMSNGKGAFEIRIGIHTGSVVAGIVGIKKFAYDIWGDTVNTASRMESSSEPGKINVSGSTYELVKDEFSFLHRGKIEAKNKGQIDMYYLQ